jgi:small-conductance mechanosensitive channel
MATVPDRAAEPREGRKQRVDRELIELLNELRVALPGIQVLFAFLLILPFSQGWAAVSELERLVYFATFLFTAAATALLIAPSSYHRLRFRAGTPAKERMLLISNRLAVAGLACVAVAIAGTVFLIADVLFGGLAAFVVAVAVGLWFCLFWYVIPLRSGRSVEDRADDTPDAGQVDVSERERRAIRAADEG